MLHLPFRPVWKSLLRAAAVHTISILLLCSVSPLQAASNESPVTVTLGTGLATDGFITFGQHLAEAINATESGLQIKVQDTLSSRQNLQLLTEGKLDLGFVEGNIAHELYGGKQIPETSLRVLSVLYPMPGIFVVRADSDYRNIHDLKGKSVALGTINSGVNVLAEQVLRGMGLDPEKDFKAVIPAHITEAVALLKQHKVEAIWGVGVGGDSFMQLANRKPGIRFIAPDAKQLQRITARYPYLKKLSIPPRTYPGQRRQVTSLGLWGQILIGPHVPEEVVYRLADALHQGKDAMALSFKHARYTNAKVTVAQVPAEYIHTGAYRYFNKLGLTQLMCR